MVIKTLVPGSIKLEGQSSGDFLKEVIGKGLERYNNIRAGIMLLFKRDESATPIIIYEVANLLDSISMREYQNTLIEFVAQKLDGTDYTKEIDFKLYEFYYKGAPLEKTWNEILRILGVEKVRAIELSRIAAEIRTSAMENFIGALDSFILSRTEKKEEEKKDEKTI